MSIRHYCDICDTLTRQTGTRRWQNIIGTTGLEVIILQEDKPVGDHTVCDSCLLEMFYGMLERSPDSQLSQRQQDLERRENRVKRELQKIADKEAQLQSWSQDLTARQDTLDSLKDLYSDHKKNEQTIKTALQEVEVIKAREKEIIRLAEARGYQTAVDRYEYREYDEAVARNQFNRGR